MRRVPVESERPIAWFAALRVAIVAVSLIALVAFDIPHRGRLIVLVAAAGAPVALGILYASARAPAVALHPAIALVDLAILTVAQAIAPASYGATHFLALFLIAAHAHFQGPARGVVLAAAGIVLLVPAAALTDAPVSGSLLAFYETLFAAAALAAGFFVGRLRAAESAGRIRARELSRRVLDAEGKVRRRVAEDLHDGPVQELVSLDLTLEAAARALGRGDSDRATEILREARVSTERSIGALRDEIVSLGPYALDELSLDVALEQCAPTWAKRYGIEVELDLDRLELPNELCGALFGVAQEAVANAGRHASARNVVVSLHADGGDVVELRVTDDGRGFREAPFAADQPGHIGLATMRERAELAGGRLRIDTGERGTTVVARVPGAPESRARY